MKRCSHPNLATGAMLGLNFLHEKDCEKIHEASLEILKDRGMLIESEEARKVLCDNGCWQDKEGCIRFPRTLIEQSLETTPSQFTHYGRTPDDDIRIAPDQVYAANFGEGIYINDLETGKRRTTTKQDAVNVARVVDALDNIHIYNRALSPQDVPTQSANLHNAEVGLTYSSKPMSLVAGSLYQTKKLIEMAEIAAGGKEELKARPRHSFNIGTITPLLIPKEACECAMLVAEAGMTNNIIVMSQQGATAPASSAGCMATHNAEFIAFNTLLQCVKKGAPVFYGSSSCVMEMRRGLSLVGAPESFLLNAAMARMANYYNLPSYVAGG